MAPSRRALDPICGCLRQNRPSEMRQMRRRTDWTDAQAPEDVTLSRPVSQTHTRTATTAGNWTADRHQLITSAMTKGGIQMRQRQTDSICLFLSWSAAARGISLSQRERLGGPCARNPSGGFVLLFLKGVLYSLSLALSHPHSHFFSHSPSLRHNKRIIYGPLLSLRKDKLSHLVPILDRRAPALVCKAHIYLLRPRNNILDQHKYIPNREEVR